MTEVIVTHNELAFLKKKIEQHLIDRPEAGVIKWNSNPKSYEFLSDIITKKIQKISITFLRDLFYITEYKKSIRVKSMNKLYQFLFQKDREDYLKKHNLNFNAQRYVYSLFEITNKELPLKLQNDDNIKYQLLYGVPLDTFLSHFVENRDEIYLYINDDFLKDFNCLELLFELFTNRLIPFIFDYNLEFIFDKAVLDKNKDFHITSASGIISYLKYWHNNILFSPEILDKYNVTLQEAERTLKTILYNLPSISLKKDNSQEKTSVENLVPLLQQINRPEIKSLDNIYAENSRGKTKANKYNFLGVLGYRDYLSSNKKDSLLRYFYFCNTEIEKSERIRIFTMPAKRVRSKGWSTQLSLEESKIVYQYIMMNYHLGSHTHLLLFNEESDLNVMCHQDYCIRINKYPSQTNKFVSPEHLLDSYSRGRLSVTDKDAQAKLYFTYPNNKDGGNQMISTDNKTYVNRMFNDFKNRFTLGEQDTENSYMLSINKNTIDELLLRLNLNTLGQKYIDELNAEVKSYIDFNTNTTGEMVTAIVTDSPVMA